MKRNYASKVAPLHLRKCRAFMVPADRKTSGIELCVVTITGPVCAQYSPCITYRIDVFQD